MIFVLRTDSGTCRLRAHCMIILVTSIAMLIFYFGTFFIVSVIHARNKIKSLTSRSPIPGHELALPTKAHTISVREEDLISQLFGDEICTPNVLIMDLKVNFQNPSETFKITSRSKVATKAFRENSNVARCHMYSLLPTYHSIHRNITHQKSFCAFLFYASS